MTKVRKVGSTHEAIDRAFGLLTIQVAADVIDRSTSYLRRASNPDDNFVSISFDETCLLDDALSQAGHQPVFRDLASSRLKCARGSNVGDDPVTLGLDAFATAGRLAQAIRNGRCPDGPAGRLITRAENEAILQEAYALDLALRPLIHQCKVRQARFSANPRGEAVA